MRNSFSRNFQRAMRAWTGEALRRQARAERREIARYRHSENTRAARWSRIAVGDRFADLVVETVLGAKPGSPNTNVYVLCRCACRGSSGPGWRVVRADNLRNGSTTSCGCFRSYKNILGRARFPPGTGSRGRYATYVLKAGERLTEQLALLELPWPGPGTPGRPPRSRQA